jgi:hypothetical protein
MGDLRPDTDLAEIRKRVESEAKNNLAQSISVRVKAVSTAQTQSRQTRTNNEKSATLEENYDEFIQLFTDTEIGKVEISSFHDEANKRIYAFARVKNGDLADYYVSRIEFYLQTAANEFEAAKQFADSDKRRSALEKTQKAGENIEEAHKFTQFLSVVDYKDGVARFLDAGAKLKREIAAFETALRDVSVFITGKESIDKNTVNILIPALKSKYSESGCRVSDNREDAAYVLTVEAGKCQRLSNSGDFVFCYVCVEADVFNMRTGKSEAKISFTQKEGWTNRDAEMACRKAFEAAAEELVKNIQTKTQLCK